MRIVNLLSVRQGALPAADTRIIGESLLIQIAFAAAIFALTLFLLRQRGRES